MPGQWLEDLAAAEEFYKKSLRSKKFWAKEKKKTPKEFKQPGFVSTEFLIDLWGFPLIAQAMP